MKTQQEQDYTFSLVQEDDTFKWVITETRTGQVYGEYAKESECVNQMIALLSSSTFDGFTPSFILIDVKPAISNVSKIVYEDDLYVSPEDA